MVGFRGKKHTQMAHVPVSSRLCLTSSVAAEKSQARESKRTGDLTGDWLEKQRLKLEYAYRNLVAHSPSIEYWIVNDKSSNSQHWQKGGVEETC